MQNIMNAPVIGKGFNAVSRKPASWLSSFVFQVLIATHSLLVKSLLEDRDGVQGCVKYIKLRSTLSIFPHTQTVLYLSRP